MGGLMGFVLEWRFSPGGGAGWANGVGKVGKRWWRWVLLWVGERPVLGGRIAFGGLQSGGKVGICWVKIRYGLS